MHDLSIFAFRAKYLRTFYCGSASITHLYEFISYILYEPSNHNSSKHLWDCLLLYYIIN